MALVLANRVQDSTTTTGTGTITLANSPATGFQSFAAIGNGNTTYYTITSGSAWEVGIGTYSSTGPTLARTTILSSSNAGAAISLTGTSTVFVSYPAEYAVQSQSPTITTPTFAAGGYQMTAQSAPSYNEGLVWYDSAQHSLAFYNDGTTSPVYIGENVQVKVINNTGSTIANGIAVYVTGTASGQIYPNIALAQANSTATSAVIGLTNGSIANGAIGYVTTQGIITNVNTGTLAPGTVLYLSPYSAGQLQGTVPPTGLAVQVGTVTYQNSSVGQIYVEQKTPLAVSASTITDTVAVANGGTGIATAPANGALLIGNGTGYASSTLTAGSNVTITNSAGGITIASASPTLTVGTTATSGGAAGQIMFDTGSVLSESSGLTWNNSTKQFTATGNGSFGGAAISAAAWTTNGIGIKQLATTYTDTTSSGSVALAYMNYFAPQTIAASSTTTYSSLYGTYFAAPLTGTNASATNIYALGAASLVVGGFLNVTGSVTLGTTSAISIGAATGTGLITVGQSTGAQTLNLGTGATTSSTTKTINFGTGGVSGSTTVINIGSTAAPGVITVNGSYQPLTAATTSGSTITPTSGTTNQYNVTALAASATIAAPSGTPVDGQRLTIRIKDNGTAQALTWTTTSGAYRAVGVTLPTTTVISKALYVGCIYNSQDSFWDVVAVAQQ